MIFCRHENVLLFTPPHVASKALGRAFAAQRGAIVCFEPSPDGSGYIDQHGTRIPNGLEHCRRGVVVRNPYDRAVGLWFHLVWWNSIHGFGCSDFRDFAQWLAAGRHPDAAIELSWMYLWPIAKWLGQLTYHFAIRFEHVADDCRHFGIPIAFPPEAVTRRKAWPTYYSDQATVDAVTEWARDDFALGGYVPGLIEADPSCPSPEL